MGLIDLYEFDPKNSRAGIGIVVLADYRRKGVGDEALKLIIQYSFNRLQLHQVFARIGADNQKSIQLFEKHGFVNSGIKKDWIFSNGSFKDEILYQKINITT